MKRVCKKKKLIACIHELRLECDQRLRILYMYLALLLVISTTVYTTIHG